MAEKRQAKIDVTDGAAIPSAKDRGLLSAWWVSIIGALTAIALLSLSDNPAYFASLKFLFPDGIIVTFKVTVFSILLALLLGLVTGLGRISHNRAVNLVASTYVEVIRGIPLLVQLFYIYFALGHVFRNLPRMDEALEMFQHWPDFAAYGMAHICDFLKNMPPLVAAVTAMGFCYGAYMGEVFRAGIESIDKGQTEAARSLGFDRRQTMFLVVLPQAWRTILPPVGNEFIALLKDSSLVSILAVADILRRGREYASVSFNYFEAYTMVALVYLIITLLLSKGVSAMENRLNYYDHHN
ncbi:amino acid ABC transporter permease [Desulfocurvus sp.]|jgi:polar amino acid transport system permease protein|uniref:amino acid ABC transporter permease n=1 Tax=Desulfocurvus sp. TaxID=2871698 RepID=UPI0025BFD439|nr:amino acid ABC transporter permease [Desulfocurvus sp.]MCK9240184.1 amino acid ABC transporter permease [Desulfocurvus sp.]